MLSNYFSFPILGWCPNRPWGEMRRRRKQLTSMCFFLRAGISSWGVNRQQDWGWNSVTGIIKVFCTPYSVQSNQIINNLSLLAFILISLIVDSISHPLYGDPKMRHFHLHCSTTPTSRIMTGIETPYYYCMHDH